MISYEEIQKWLKWISDLKISNHFKEISNFFFHPNKFWTHYDSLLNKDRVIQLTTYASLYILIFLLSTANHCFWDGMHVLLMELLGILPFVLCVVLAVVVAQFSIPDKAIINKSILLCIYSYCLFIPFQILFLSLFYNSENYLFYALACVVSIIAEIFVVLVSLRIFVDSIKGKIVYICAVLCFFTILDLSMDKLGFVSKSSNFKDVVTQERFELGKSIKNPYTIPTHVISHENEAIFYLYSSPIDSIAVHKYSEELYFEELNTDIDSLLRIIPRTRYKTNREFFTSMYIIKKQIKYINDNKSYEANPVIKRDTIWHDKNTLTCIEYREFSPDCSRMNRDILELDIKYSTTFENAQKIGYLRCLYRPYVIWKLFTNKAD